MKKNYFISLVFAAVMFVSCGKKAIPLENFIPNDAIMFMRVDVKNLVLKADNNLFENEKIKLLLEKEKVNLDNNVQKKIFDNFIKNPNSLGIDVVGDAYFFMNSEVVGFLMSVNNAKKIYKNIIAFEPDFRQLIIKEKGVYTAQISHEDGVKIVWDNGKIMLLVSIGGEYDTDYFNLSAEKSIISDVNYQKFIASKSDFSTYYSYTNYGKLIRKMMGMLSAFAELDENFEMPMQFVFLEKMSSIFDGISVIMSCNFETGKIAVKTQMLYATTEDEKRFAEFYNYFDVRLTGEFFKYIPQNPLFLLAMNFDGEKILAMFEKFGLTSLFDNLLGKLAEDKGFSIDYKMLISGIKGDVMMSIKNTRVNTDNHSFSTAVSVAVFAKLSNPDAVKMITKNIMKKVGIAPQPNGSYILGKEEVVGIKDDFFYLVTKGFDEKENNLTEKIKDQPVFLYGDLSGLNETIKEIPQLQMFSYIIGKGLMLVENYESNYIDKNNFEITVNFTDKKENSLKQIFGFINEATATIPF